MLALADALQSGAEQIENIPLVVVGGLCGDLWVIDGKLLTISRRALALEVVHLF